jgi:DHA1 family tetracycline resistance protein-like MFS transporter
VKTRAAPILLLTFVNAIGGTLLIPVLPFVVRDLGRSDFVFALLIAAYPAAQFFAAPLLGSIADNRGRRPVLLVSQAGTLASWVLFGAAWFVDGDAALVLIAVSRVVDGLTGGNASVAAAYLADVTTPDERTRIFSLQGAIAGVALIIGPALGAFTAATSIGFFGPALLAMAISAGTLIWMMVSLEESLTEENRSTSLNLNPLHQLNLIGQFRHLSGRGPLFRLFSTQVLFTLTFGAYTTIVVLWYVDRLGVSETTAGLLLLVVGVFLIFNELVTVRFAEKMLGDLGTLVLGVCLLPMGFILVRMPTTILWFLPASFVLNAGMALVMPTLQSLITQVADDREEGAVQGINTSMAAVASTAAPIAAGALYASGGGEATLLAIAAVATVTAVVILASYPVIARATENAPTRAPRKHGPVYALAHRFGGGRRSFGLDLDEADQAHHGIERRQPSAASGDAET